MKFKSVQSGVLKVAIIGIAIILGCVSGYYIYQMKKFKEIGEVAKLGFDKMVTRILVMGTDKYSSIVKDNSAWSDLCVAIQNNDLEWIDDNLGYMLKSYSAENISLMDSSGKIIYSNNSDSLSSIDLFPFDKAEILNRFQKEPLIVFFGQHADDLYIYFGSKVVSTNDEYSRVESAKGFLFLVGKLNNEDIENIKTALGGHVGVKLCLDENTVNQYVNSVKPFDCLKKELYGFSGEIEGHLCISFSNPMETQLSEFLKVVIVLTGEILFILISILLYVNKKVTRPLKKLSRALKNENTDPIMPLVWLENEIGQISSMMISFFGQKQEISMQNEVLRQQKEEITAQNEHMQQLNEELLSTNESLDLQKKQIEEKNSVITRANRQLTDSITYASRLQSSMLIAHSPYQSWFKDSFTIYLPKEIVSGDFYVAHKVGSLNIAILGDCTGHGVPGAILVTMGISFLYQIIDSGSFELMPDILLRELRRKVIQTFAIEENGQGRPDGMDVAIVTYDTETGKSYFAGAQRPMVMVRDNEMTVIKGDSMPIGRYIKDGDFTRVELKLKKGDKVYLYSDGCTDQVGGSKKRKIMSRDFRAKILEFSSLSFVEQKEKIENFILDWKGDLPQTDDISMLAFEV